MIEDILKTELEDIFFPGYVEWLQLEHPEVYQEYLNDYEEEIIPILPEDFERSI